MKVIYVCTADVSVYESQVLELLEYYKNNNVEVLLLQGYRNDKERSDLEKKMSNHIPINTIWYKWYPHYSIFKFKHVKTIKKALLTASCSQDTVIHVRGDLPGFIVKKAVESMNIFSPILVDMRAVVSEEMKYTLSLVPIYNKLQILLLKLYFESANRSLFVANKNNISISSVSPVINTYLTSKFPLCKYDKYYNPNIAGKRFVYSEIARKRVREKYGFHDDDVVVVCSTNSNALWQKDETVIDHLLQRGFKVLNLSAVDPKIPGCITTKVPFNEMPDYLSAADMAVLWREDTFMNNSASPSKFSEFAVMGLYVIHNGSVEVASSHIMKTGSGCVVQAIDDFDIDPKKWNGRNKRLEWIEKGKDSFGVEGISQAYINIYKKLKQAASEEK